MQKKKSKKKTTTKQIHKLIEGGSEEDVRRLLRRAKIRLPHLKASLVEMSNHWGYEDPIYRFYHHSFKVYEIQEKTRQVLNELKALAPHLKLNMDFTKIVNEGTGKVFSLSDNSNWLRHTRPIVEAFFHTRHMLAMVCKYAEKLTEPPQMLPSGWATVLYLYDLR